MSNSGHPGLPFLVLYVEISGVMVQVGSFVPPQENERTKDLIIEQKFHRTIIGQKGERIKEVRDKFPEVLPPITESNLS